MSNHRICIELVHEPIDHPSLLEKLADPDVGAHGWFIGVTRRTTEDRVTEMLSYEAHESMAKCELQKLAEAAIERFNLFHVVIVHRLGEVPIGEASVVLGCSSAHRPATFQSLAWIMDVLKRDVPIWKKEHYTDGLTEWVHPTAKNQ